jgi:plasmid stabilization system protein ParE
VGWRLTAHAERDLGEIHLYVAQREGTARADALIARIGETFDHLAAFPHSGTPSRVTDDITVFEKVVPRAPYRVYYKILANGIVIQRIWHTARRPPDRI